MVFVDADKKRSQVIHTSPRASKVHFLISYHFHKPAQNVIETVFFKCMSLSKICIH